MKIKHLVKGEASEDLFYDMLKEKYDISGVKSSAYQEVIDYKTKHVMEPITGNDDVIFMLPEITNIEYSSITYENYKNYLQRFSKDEGAKKYLSMLAEISPDEIAKNKIDKRIYNFPEGTRSIKTVERITKLIILNKPYDYIQKTLGGLKLNPTDKKDIYLSIKPELFIAGGAIGNSCLSRWGTEETSLMVYASLSMTMIAYDEDFSWRAWIFVDHDKKIYSFLGGYPRENFYGQAVVYNYFKNKGYSLTTPIYVDGFFYIDTFNGLRGLTKKFNGRKETISDTKYLKHDLISGLEINDSSFLNSQAAISEEDDTILWGYTKTEAQKMDKAVLL